MPATLVDTNVLVYAHDPRDRRKQATAKAVFDALIASDQAVVSVQCLTEFCSIAQRLPEAMSMRHAVEQAERIARASRVVDLTAAVTFEGLRGTVAYQLSIWDALIWSAAKLNQIPYVLSEDFTHGRVLEGVRFLDPFATDFDLKVLSA